MSEEKPNNTPQPPPNQDKTVVKPSSPQNQPTTHDAKPKPPSNISITEDKDR